MDTGGTFTDCVFVRNGRLEILKVPSTPDDPARAIISALEKVIAGREPALGTHLRHNGGHECATGASRRTSCTGNHRRI